MSRGFVKDGDQEEVPIVPPRAFLPKGVINYVTREGMDALVSEKEEILSERDHLKGNETDRRVTRNYLNAKLDLLEERIRTAVVADVKIKDPDAIGLGAFIHLKINDSCRTIRITGADEASAGKNCISFFSPLASALSGHKAGEKITVSLPAGVMDITVISVSYSDKDFYSVMEEDSSSGSSGSAGVEKNNSDGNNKATKQMAVENISSDDTSAHHDNEEIHEDANEIFPIVNERGIIIGRASRWQVHDGSKLLHPVVHLHLFNSEGELFLQKRPEWKSIQPNKWDTSVGGHVGFGEKIEDALKRETMEELGIDDFTPVFIKRYVFESSLEKELVHAYKTIYDGPINPGSELAGGRFWSHEEILENIGKKIFTPNFESEYRMLFLTGGQKSVK